MVVIINDVVISPVKIIFDSVFIEYIKGIQLLYPHYLSESNVYYLEQEQEEIRNYILNTEQRLNFTNDDFKITSKNKPEIFIIMMSIISDISRCESFGDILKQNKQDDIGDEEEAPERNDEVTCCACGHGVLMEHAPIINNKITNKFLLIGCDCALKEAILTKKQVSSIKKKRITRIKNIKKEIEKTIKTIQDVKNLKLKESIFNVFKNNWIIKKEKELRRLNTLVYLSIPAYDKHIASFYGCNWNPHIKKWCTTMAVYELNNSLHKYKSFNPHV